MKPLNVLLVTYSFPPAGGVGVLRAASLARYFPGEDIRLDVLSARNASAVGADPTLLAEIPPEVTVHHTVTLDLPFGMKKAVKRWIGGAKQSAGAKAAATSGGGKSNVVKKALQELLLPDPQVTWLPFLTRAARRIIRTRKIDLVLLTVPPFSVILLVEKLRKEFPDLPIVIDFRDEWLSTAIDLVGFNKSDRARRIARNTEAAGIRHATAIVAVTEAARRDIRGRYPQEPDAKFCLVPNGFDATRLPPRSTKPAKRPADGKIVIAHIGTVYPSTEPTSLVEALLLLPPELRSRLKLRFIGHIEEPRYRESLQQLGDMVELKGFLPQREALAEMNEADYVLLVQHGPLNVATKFYDYLGGGRPILATVHPEGDERRLLEELHAGWWTGSRDIEGIRRLFVDAAARGDVLESGFGPDPAKVMQYDRKTLAQRYAALLHSIARPQREADSQAPAVGVAEESR
jgi:glycosyltransferase involved in cell wall biosynthesis